MFKRNCQHCRAIHSVSRTVEVQEWPYGQPDAEGNQFMLVASLPVWTCEVCQESYTDHQGEHIRDMVTNICMHEIEP